MICINADISQELGNIDDELKAIYHSKNTICFFIFKDRKERNGLVGRAKGMTKVEQESVYQEYQS